MYTQVCTKLSQCDYDTARRIFRYYFSSQWLVSFRKSRISLYCTTKATAGSQWSILKLHHSGHKNGETSHA